MGASFNCTLLSYCASPVAMCDWALAAGLGDVGVEGGRCDTGDNSAQAEVGAAPDKDEGVGAQTSNGGSEVAVSESKAASVGLLLRLIKQDWALFLGATLCSVVSAVLGIGEALVVKRFFDLFAQGRPALASLSAAHIISQY